MPCATLLYSGASFWQWPHQGATNATTAARSSLSVFFQSFALSSFTFEFEGNIAADATAASASTIVVVFIGEGRGERARTGC